MKNKKLGQLSNSEVVSRLFSVSDDLHRNFYLYDKLPFNKRLFLSSLILEIRNICMDIMLSDFYEE